MTLPISVIIPCYKQEHWLQGAVDSANEAHVRIYKDAFEPFRAGVCYARNFLITFAKDELILPLDADDRLYPDALERMYAAWRPGTFVYGTYTEIDEDENIIREMDAPPPKMIYRKNLTYSTFLFSRDDWKKVGGYDPDFEPLEEDFAFQCALVNAGVMPIKLDGAPLYKRMVHANSRTARAMKYWNVTVEMCNEKFPGAFVV